MEHRVNNRSRGSDFAMKGICVYKKVSFCGLAGFGFFCLIFLSLSQWHGNPLKYRTQSISEVDCLSKNADDIEDAARLEDIEKIVESTRKSVRDDMTGYPYPNGTYNVSAAKLEDLVIEKNGRPVRSVVVSAWRSGSTFIGHIINAHPANFYDFEPLMDFEIVKIRGAPLAEYAIKRLKALLNCDYKDLGRSIDHSKKDPTVFSHNEYLWEQCQTNEGMCHNHRFLSKMCQVFPFQSMKIVGLRLSIAQKLLDDENLGVRMVLLVRDPRGTMQSRKHCTWCKPSADCSDPALLCADLVSDYKTAVELLKKCPTTFRVIRYEDLSEDPYTRTKELFKFYGRDFHENVEEFLDSHTTTVIDGMYSTYRDTKSAPFRWKTELTFEEVEEIQQSCSVAMKHWGYVPAMNATHLIEFDPVTDYVLD